MSPRPPGFLRQSENPEVRLMIGTAGHVDHGKTRLVRFLTGCETDRLQEEQERGLSIELGFAPCSLGSGIACGIVDVPGHEQFIKNMVAGAAGMDLCILVVAADDGVMPQTVEHLQIMQFLGVQSGLVALTKIDLVKPERVEEVSREIEALVLGTFLQGAPICPVSSETFEGFDKFYHTLVETALHVEVQRQRGVFRMPVERVFSSPGHGTVATGIPLAGRVREGDEVEVQPGGARARVRSIQRFLRPAGEGGAGQCLALNLAGLAREAVERGHVVAAPGYVHPASVLLVRLSTCDNLNPPLRHGEDVRVHTGTVEAQAKLSLYEATTLARNAHGFASLHLAHPIAASPTDRLVVRRNSPSITVAGGVILRALAERPRESRAHVAAELAARWAALGTPEARACYFFESAGMAGGTLHAAAVESLLSGDEAAGIVESLVAAGQLLRAPAGDRLFHPDGSEALCGALPAYLRQCHEAAPSLFGPTLSEAAAGLRIPEDALACGVAWLEGEGKFLRRENRIGLAEEKPRFDDRRAQLLSRIEQVFRDRRFTTPRPDELPELLKVPASEIDPLLDYLCQAGTLIRLGKNVVFHSLWIKEAERIVVESIDKNGTLDSADFKTLIDSSRKYALAILDHFDTIHTTHRVGNLRRLHAAYLRRRGGRS